MEADRVGNDASISTHLQEYLARFDKTAEYSYEALRSCLANELLRSREIRVLDAYQEADRFLMGIIMRSIP
jgi:hypothetical protein